MTKTSTVPTCENCGKELFGRTDKRFCNDSCRNEFNRKKRFAEQISDYETLPEILKLIKRNHEILKSYKLEGSDPETIISVKRSELLKKGYHFKFFTSIYRDKMGQLWKYCFDYGIKEENETVMNNSCEISYNLDQIDIDRPDTFVILKNN